MNIFRPRQDLPGISPQERENRSNARVGTIMIFVYAFFAFVIVALGALSNGCRMEENPVVHVE